MNLVERKFSQENNEMFQSRFSYAATAVEEGVVGSAASFSLPSSRVGNAHIGSVFRDHEGGSVAITFFRSCGKEIALFERP